MKNSEKLNVIQPRNTGQRSERFRLLYAELLRNPGASIEETEHGYRITYE